MDERRIRDMLKLLAQGLSAAEAARAVLGTATPEPPAPATVKAQLTEAFAHFDEPEPDELLSGSLSALGHDVTLREVVYPLLRELGTA